MRQPKDDYKNCRVVGPLIERYVNGKKRLYIRIVCKQCLPERAVVREVTFNNHFPEDGQLCRKCGSGNRTHGMHGTLTYDRWQGMWHRVMFDPHYIKRQIQVEDRKWTTFPGFFEDMGECPPGMTLERIDNSRGYGKILMPDGTRVLNCKWADRVAQNNNTSRNVVITVNGQSMTVAQAVRTYGISYTALYKRMFERGEDADTAVAELVKKLDAGPTLTQIAQDAGVGYEKLRRQITRGRRSLTDAIAYLQQKAAQPSGVEVARMLGVPYYIVRNRMNNGLSIQEAIDDIRQRPPGVRLNRRKRRPAA